MQVGSRINRLTSSRAQRSPARVIAGRRVASHRHYATETTLDRTNAIKPSITGQPLSVSHPHLVKQTELTAGIPHSEYESRRKRLMEQLPDDSIVVSVAGTIKYMSKHIFYKFRQSSDFWYLTGFEEPDSAVVLEKNSSSKGYRMTLFCGSKIPDWEKWNGPRTGPELACDTFRADDAQDITRLPSYLKSALPKFSFIYTDAPPSARKKSMLNYLTPSFQSKNEFDNIAEMLSGSRRRPLGPELFKLRAIKSEAEKHVMRRAADISAEGHVQSMRFTQPGRSEAEIAAHFEYTCALMGSQRLAYVPVVASGPNALMIHYIANNHIVNSGELILVDAGCEYNGYASDITRTWPSTGRFSPPQRDLYQAVLNAQKTCIKLCTESAGLTMMDLHRRSCKFLSQELRNIGFSLGLGDLERILYPHFISHGIGIDLHETESNRTDRLKAGNVITIEPGIYVPPDSRFPKAFHNIGIRIEDEVLVESDHAIILSVNAPKEVVDVEGTCQSLLDISAEMKLSKSPETKALRVKPIRPMSDVVRDV